MPPKVIGLFNNTENFSLSRSNSEKISPDNAEFHSVLAKK
jgi:hypothetical protein